MASLQTVNRKPGIGRLIPNAIIATGLSVILPALPPHLPGLAFGPGLGGVIAGARSKAGLKDSLILAAFTGIGVACVSLFFLLLVQFVRMSVPASSVSGTIFAQLDASLGLTISLGVATYSAVCAGLGALFGGWLSRRGSKPAEPVIEEHGEIVPS